MVQSIQANVTFLWKCHLEMKVLSLFDSQSQLATRVSNKVPERQAWYFVGMNVDKETTEELGFRCYMGYFGIEI